MLSKYVYKNTIASKNKKGLSPLKSARSRSGDTTRLFRVVTRIGLLLHMIPWRSIWVRIELKILNINVTPPNGYARWSGTNILYLFLKKSKMDSMPDMNAMESLQDKNMVYLDLLSGFIGALLFLVMESGYLNINWNWKTVIFGTLAVLVSRVIVDFIYYHTVSKTEKFGGTLKEFLISSAVWWVLAFIMLGDLSLIEKFIMYAMTFWSMLAISRLTHWG
jgi:hypothetical protein